MSRHPVVGLTSYGERASYWIITDEQVVLLTRNYVDMVAAAGGTPVLLPPTATAADAVDVCDALLVVGGPDVDPARYGAEPGPHSDPPRTERDDSDLAALRRALDRRIPVLGVCRGHQLLNVALGGTLHQHLPDVVGHLRHSVEPATFGPVTVAPEPGSRVARALGGDEVQVWCHHHQAIDRVADGLTVTARADDGTVEAVELDGHPFVVGVQWHPEQEPRDVRMFAALVEAAAG
ncbi:gamma-glutamyl-gamma-aminobutyrate hydrolase family protein [Pseudonocardia endophytica]|uniref:Anthranilate synthase component 2/putative glutamine amidotransferase n=1 Tax=Pseudonocardia endophytica TaxID=401976 RepID=A0A4R1HSZ7_PSEEN|nr:gamma-glutamyl-gamma-aminobutyrate hydrolase family protein [Pseudonocardia endophytica]TCK22989.1 anthranilate synthase component 2/putative glutamine amidotransferase [Pseudonocardia endophytica]